MKKQKKSRENRSAGAAAVAPEPQKLLRWWPYAVAAAALFVVFAVYGPALNGAFVLDDRALPFMSPRASAIRPIYWLESVRPLLYFTFWINYSTSAIEPYWYHVTNVLLHFLTSVMVTLIVAKLAEWAGVMGRHRAVLAVFAGALFLLHPIQTESVAYVASRSENLSVLCYYAAFAVFLYRSTESITLLRSLAVLALFGAAVATKEHTLTLPVLLVLTDYFWGRGGIRKHDILYGLLVIGGAAGALMVWRVVSSANTVGFRMGDLTPVNYFFTQCRVIWTYVRLFFLPLGQNIDPDVPLSAGLLDHGAIFGLAALIAVVVAAWIYRRRFPLGSFGILVFLLLLAPTSSIVPIRDVMAERRLYLPFLGLTLICVEGLRRLRIRDAAGICAAVLVVSCILTYQRNEVWASPLVLWEDTTAKSPQKLRPRFQYAFALYEEGRCPESAQAYDAASHLAPPAYDLLVDWALALDCAGRSNDALDRLSQAAGSQNTAQLFAVQGMVYAKQGRASEALQALAKAENLDPSFEMTYVYRGNIYAIAGDRNAATREYQRALNLNPLNQAARDALVRANR